MMVVSTRILRVPFSQSRLRKPVSRPSIAMVIFCNIVYLVSISNDAIYYLFFYPGENFTFNYKNGEEIVDFLALGATVKVTE